jgi:hypothetical protein
MNFYAVCTRLDTYIYIFVQLSAYFCFFLFFLSIFLPFSLCSVKIFKAIIVQNYESLQFSWERIPKLEPILKFMVAHLAYLGSELQLSCSRGLVTLAHFNTARTLTDLHFNFLSPLCITFRSWLVSFTSSHWNSVWLFVSRCLASLSFIHVWRWCKFFCRFLSACSSVSLI